MTKEPTCINKGYYDRKCEICRLSLIGEIEPLGHDEISVPAVDATCTAPGLTEGARCSRCSITMTEQKTTKPLGHIEVPLSAVAPTCTEAGFTEGSCCSRCRQVFVEQLPVPPEHTGITVIDAIPATCTETGFTEGSRCNACGKTLEEPSITKALGHDPIIDSYVSPTCISDGLTEGAHCSRCNIILIEQVPIPSSGHGEPKVIPGYAATCTAPGKTEGVQCSVCKQILTAQTEIPRLPHTEVKIPATAATCSFPGKTEGKRCSVCRQILTAQTEIPMLPHTEVVDTPYKAPTCETTGVNKGSHCKVCNAIISKASVIAKKPHTLNAEKICTVCGLKTYSSMSSFINDCQNNGESLIYVGKATKIDLTLDKSADLHEITFPDSVCKMTFRGDRRLTYNNLRILSAGYSVKYIIFENVNIMSSKTIVISHGETYMYMTGTKNSFIITGTGTTGKEGSYPINVFGGTAENGGTGGDGIVCFLISNCYMYTKCSELIIQAGKGGKGGTAGSAAGVFSKNGNGGTGGRGGFAFSGQLYLNAASSKDLYSHEFTASGTYSIKAGEGGEGGNKSSALIYASGGAGNAGVKGASGFVSANIQQAEIVS